MEEVFNALLVRHATWIDTLQDGDPSKSRHSTGNRLLRAMIAFAPVATGRHWVEEQVAQCDGEGYQERLLALSNRFLDTLLIPLSASGAKTPQPNTPYKQLLEQQLDEELPLVVKRLEVKNRVLRRDGYKCVITSLIDIDSCHKGLVTGDDLELPRCHSHAAHILPFPLAETSRFAALWDVIEHFAGIKPEELQGELIDRMENLVTICLDKQICFGKLELWLNPIPGEPFAYSLEADHRDNIPSQRIDLVAHSPDPLPDRRYLAFHAACAKVLEESGGRKIVEEHIYEMEHVTVLDGNGSSAEFFQRALGAA